MEHDVFLTDIMFLAVNGLPRGSLRKCFSRTHTAFTFLNMNSDLVTLLSYVIELIFKSCFSRVFPQRVAKMIKLGKNFIS